MTRPAVSIIGAGPGDPRLITVYGLECLRAADVVVYDHLIPRRLLAHARAGAELIDVGTAAPQPMAQEAISYLLVEKAREGKVVARLKWGDPFVFDRGGEEALFLHEQRVPFEVVPGIPAGIGVPAYAGVPVSYPGAGDTITLVRGYEDESRLPPEVDWASLARLDGTVVCYAGAHQLPRILDAMRASGWSADTQGVVIYNGTLPNQETLSGTIAELADIVHDTRRRAASLLVVGRVTGLREHLRWYDARPLFGRRVLVTRAREQAGELADRLAALGAEPVEAPVIRIAPPEDRGPLLVAAATPAAFDWIVFTSANAVDAFMQAVLEGGRDVRALSGPKLCTVGPGTADRLAQYGVKVDLIPEEFRAEGVLRALAGTGRMEGLRVLLPRADIGREVIADELRRAGAVVSDVVAYRTVLEDSLPEQGPDVYGMLLQGQIDVVTFTSASAVRGFARIYGAEQATDLLEHTVVAVIGPTTAEAARQAGFPVTVQPSASTVPALVDAIVAHYAQVKSTKTV
ncbi:MAG: uroporphyrinogen-III C-methyltransferase [Acidobacteria bacterium]|nr:uroporphyrinogen-III C-methyltransferase [Acidobacteriota bacterium]